MYRHLRHILLVAASLLYLAFLICDVWLPGTAFLSAVLKYSGVLLCVAFVLLCRPPTADAAGWPWGVAAFCFTLIADLLLLFTPCFLPGVLLFCGAQLAYISRCRGFSARRGVPRVAAFVAAMLLLACVAGFPAPLRPAAMALYGALLLAAAVAPWLPKAKSGLPPVARWLARFGMLLFVLCDANVLLFNTLPPGQPLHGAAALLMWVFYLPSQVLLALSCEAVA